MERELNKLFNDTNYNKENVIIREIWSIKLELQNFFWGVYIQAEKKMKLIKYNREFLRRRMPLGTPLIQSYLKKENVPVVLLCSDEFECWIFPPPFHPIINKRIKMTPSVFAMFRCLLKVEVYLANDYEFKSSNNLYEHHQVYPKPKYRSFCNISFLTLPHIYADCTRPIQQIISSMLRFDRELSKL